MPYQIRIRRDVAATWETNDPILAVGEMGFATDTKEVRVGNGTDVWSDLEPIKSDADAIKIAGFDLEAGPPLDGEVIQFDTDTDTWVYATPSGGGDVSTDPIWVAKGDLVVGTGNNQAIILSVGGTNGHVLKVDSTTATGLAWGAASGSGTVTSIGLTMPTSIFDVAGSPIDSSGTLAVTLDNQTGNTVFAGPTSNSLSSPPTFRTLVAADIPNISAEAGPIGAALASITAATNELGAGSDQMLYLNGAKSFARTNLTNTARNLLDDTTPAIMRTTLGLTINTDVQAYDAGLQSIAGLTTAADRMLYTTALDTYAVTTLTAFGRSLIDDADAETARTTLGFKTAVGVATAPQAETTIKYVRAAQASLTKGMVVYVSGSNGNNLNVSKAQADVESTSSKTIGLLLEDFTNVGNLGYVVTEGLIEGLNTNGLTPGAAVWLSPSTAGSWTTTKPSSPSHLVFLGWIVKDNASTGSIYVKVNNGQELDELHDVAIINAANNEVLQYDTSTTPATWKNKTLSSAGIAASSHAHGNITNAGAIGSTAGLIVKTGSSGVLETLTDGSANYVLSTNGAGTLSWVAQTGGGGTPGGNTHDIQFNTGSGFGGSNKLEWDNTGDTLSVTGKILLKQQSPLRFEEGGAGTNYVAFEAPATIASDVIWTLPAADGTANQVLSTDGSGTLSWATAAGSVPDFILYRLGII